MKEPFFPTLTLPVKALFAMLVLVSALATATSTQANEPVTLDAVREKVTLDYPGIEQLSTVETAELIGRDDNIILFDVREADEYSVSRIPGAVRVDPGTWTYSFMDQFGGQLAGKTLIFYCSVGVRSSKFAQQVQQDVLSAGALHVYNLDGGIFAWHNEERELENESGATDFVHPYDNYWGRLVDRSDMIRTRPE